MPRTATVSLGGQDYQIEELRSRANAQWRAKLQEPFGGLVERLQTAGKVRIDDGAGVADLVRSVSGTLLGSVDILKGLLYDYAPALAGDRERIEAEAYDSELLEGFVEVLKLAYPFGSWVTRLGDLAAGQTRRATSAS